MVRLDPNWILIGFSVLTVLSYCYSLIAKQFYIPSVLLLIGTGMGITHFLNLVNARIASFSPWLEILGMAGIVLIVLEAALDIQIQRSTYKLVFKVFISSLVLIVLTTSCIAGVLYLFLNVPIHSSIAYAIPLSIMSSAIVIPSISHLSKRIRTFLVLESAFSDVIGIVLFYTVIRLNAADAIHMVVIGSFLKLLLSILLSFLLCLLVLYVYQRLQLHGRVFLIVAILIGIYAFGELIHFSPLITILLFGLLLNNRQSLLHPVFSWIGSLDDFQLVLERFKYMISEISFLLRTVFFTVFGMSIELTNVQDKSVYLISLSVVSILFLIRFFNLKLFHAGRFFPELFIAPRGLITVLLFLSIPETLQHANVKPLMVFLVILLTSFIMMAALIGIGNQSLYKKTLEFKKRGYNN
ncbi:MAG: cation:proton antiporter [bacterium]